MLDARPPRSFLRGEPDHDVAAQHSQPAMPAASLLAFDTHGVKSRGVRGEQCVVFTLRLRGGSGALVLRRLAQLGGVV